MPDIELFQTLAISLGLGLLVGLQRQHENARMAGVRTFPLITVFGTVCAWLAQDFGGWIIAAGALGTTALVVVANLMQRGKEHVDIGQTTEAAVLLMFAVGAYLVSGKTPVAIAIGASVAVLLHLKEPLHQAIAKLGEKDLRAIMQFVVISLVILPVLPNKTYGPYQVMNPYNIWLMVVLIVGIGLAGYFAYKVLGNKAGTLLGGMLGGLISSTATTVSYAKRSKSAGNTKSTNYNLVALVIFIATAVSLLRIIIEISVVAPTTLSRVAPPLLSLLLLMAILVSFGFFMKKEDSGQMPEQENPAHLKTALVFGVVYALVILATAAAKDHFGKSGLYIVAIISGLTDVDAITLSTSRLMNNKTIELETGWKLILVAALSNIAFKGALVAILGNKALFARVALLFGISLIAGALIIWLWPQEFVLDWFGK
ncbi:MgtC/SapB family protein [Pontibacter sp. KCTC 32443]|uniref:MgtC/SapB family protein n=1 Tax=Pontibacter TaxID=323449 RepID=UPI00164CE357|nr:MULTISPECIES: MgtC/SapB family protein [Pontibacter]MBC5775386.1 MgtC/SapB family protein [Pontibacter sp. KCTC 32443]